MHISDSYSGLGFSSACFVDIFFFVLLGCWFWVGRFLWGRGELVVTITVGFFNQYSIKDAPLLFFKNF